MHDERVRRYFCYSVKLLIWHQVNSELQNSENIHHRFWWSRHIGKALAVLLHNARYPSDIQYRDLKFFAQVVASHLDVFHEISVEGGTSPWSSFMTDDGTPLELSWDWDTKDSLPTIRNSIEPIGLHAGTSLDPHNIALDLHFRISLCVSCRR